MNIPQTTMCTYTFTKKNYVHVQPLRIRCLADEAKAMYNLLAYGAVF
jgi:hypothetical protein